ncbi:MAG: AraC family transcriptional regulator [Gemmatimonadaceae bacterium]
MTARQLCAIHHQVARHWTPPTLAGDAGISRSVLAERFAHFVGVPPMQYLARWRMQVAARLLTDGDSKVATIASMTGYESEAPFSRAFDRVVGAPPAEWRRRQASGRTSS